MKSAGMFGFLLLTVLIGAPAWSQDEVLTVTPDELITAYQDNELAGDMKFKGRQAKISGSIDRIARDPDGQAFVSLASSQRGSIYCYFPADLVDELVKLKKGRPFYATCTVQGMRNLYSIQLDKCAIN